MRYWVWWSVAVLVGSGCYVGPSEEQLQCYQGCGREKDSCMLQASSAPQIQACDTRSSRCSESCK